MEFLSSIFISLAAFLGLGQIGVDEPVVAPVVVSEEVVHNVEPEIGVGVDMAEMSTHDTELADEQPAVVNSSDNSLSSEEAKPTRDIRTTIVAGGCFWCVESDLEHLTGVVEVVSGYSGGNIDNPTYQTYGQGGHREVVEVTYDANEVSFEDILIVTMKTTDPTDDDGTFADRGDKYSAAFYYENDEQKTLIQNLISEVDANGPYDKPLAVDVEERAVFWKAEDAHQDYYKGTLTKLKYKYYRNASGRDDLIEKFWGDNTGPDLPWRSEEISTNKTYMWNNYQKPSDDELKDTLDELTYKVTQKEGTERSNTSALDKNWEEGIYVDVLSGEPLYSSKDKFDSGTGWPSFVRPIQDGVVQELVDKKLFTTRTEIRSSIADNHIGHVFDDGPQDSTGLRYCMNGVALRFVPKADMEAEGYSDFLKYL